MLDDNETNLRLTQIRQNLLLFDQTKQQFPLPTWERLRVRGRYQAWSPSPHSSPVKGEEKSTLTALSSLFCAALWRCMHRARLRYWFRVIAGALFMCCLASGAIA